MKRISKYILSLFLVFVLVCIPVIQRCYASVTAITITAILILTVLTAMGITLVVQDMSKESFIIGKGDSFMTSKGYSGSFSDWIAGGAGSTITATLRVGFLVVAKDVVDRIKEFISWLIPNAQSNTVVNLTSGQVIPTSEAVITGSFSQTAGKSYINFVPSSVLVSIRSISTTFSDGTQTLTFPLENDSDYISWTGYYDVDDTFVSSSGVRNFSGSARYNLIRNDFSFVSNSGVYFPVGIYLVWQDGSGHAGSAMRVYNVIGNMNEINNKRAFLSTAFVEQPVQAGAIIGDYDDLDDLTDTNNNNTFYLTLDGQALNPSSQDLADIIGALQQALDDVNRRLEIMGQTLTTIAEGTLNPNYSNFDLGSIDLSRLGALLTTRFPFSIPWDIIRVFEVFIADPVAPQWEVDLLPISTFEAVDTSVTLDLGDYPVIGQISRWFCIIDLCLGLCWVTKRLVWVA